MSLGKVIHVGSLEEALTHYAMSRASLMPIPTFTTTLEEWPSFIEDIKSSYTVEHEIGNKKYRWSGVMIHVTAINEAPATQLLQAPTTLQ